MIRDGVNRRGRPLARRMWFRFRRGDEHPPEASDITFLTPDPSRGVGSHRSIPKDGEPRSARTFSSLSCTTPSEFPLAVAGWLNPLIAVFAMCASSLIGSRERFADFRGMAPEGGSKNVLEHRPGEKPPIWRMAGQPFEFRALCLTDGNESSHGFSRGIERNAEIDFWPRLNAGLSQMANLATVIAMKPLTWCRRRCSGSCGIIRPSAAGMECPFLSDSAKPDYRLVSRLSCAEKSSPAGPSLKKKDPTPLQSLPDTANPKSSDQVLRYEERGALEKAIRSPLSAAAGLPAAGLGRDGFETNGFAMNVRKEA